MTEFEQIYRAYFTDVYLYIRKLSGDEQIAEEITSETFFRAMRALKSFRGDCDIRIWLCQIAKNCYYSHLKQSGRTQSIDDESFSELPGTEESIEEQLLHREDAMRIRAVVHTLPEPYREVFLWRVFAELSFREIGRLFRKSDNWACVTFHRARTMIKQRMEESDHET